jgi:hypothetical protein
VNRFLENLPTDFQALRNPITGDLGTCMVSLEGGTCSGGVLGAIRSSTFRARGITATYAIKLGRLQAGIGAGYDRRKFIAAPGTVLAAANGVTDENYWIAAYLNGRLDDRSGWSAAAYANWYDSGFNLAGSTNGYGASASYFRDLTRGLTATLAVTVDGVSSDQTFEDYVTAAGLLGLRYSF